MRTLSIRLRLTLWYTAVLFVIQMTVSFGVFLFMQNKLEAMAQSELESGFGVVSDVLRISEGDIMDVFHLGQTRMFQITRAGAVVYQTEAWKSAPWTKELTGADSRCEPPGEDRGWPHLPAEKRLCARVRL